MNQPAPILTPPRSEWLAWAPGASVYSEGIVACRDGKFYSSKPRSGHERPSSEAPAPAPKTIADSLDDKAIRHHQSAIWEMEERAGFKMFHGQRTLLIQVAATTGAIIAAEVGCGKTMLAIALIHILRPRRCLVIAPQGVMRPSKRKGDDDRVVFDASQWQREFARFAPWLQPRYTSGPDLGDGVILTYTQDALLNGGGWLSRVPPDHFDMIVVDEAHIAAASGTKTAAALFRMRPRLRFALTATPMPNHPADADNLCRWVRPDVEIPQFKITDSTCMSAFACRLRHAIAPITKADVRPDIPPLTVVVHDVEPEPGFRERYKAELLKLRDTKCVGMARRLQIAALRNVCATSTAKVEAIARSIESSRTLEPQFVVASARTAQTDMMEVRLRSGGFSVGRIDSTVSPAGHGASSSRFQNGQVQGLLMGIRSAFGHSFPDCRVIHVSSLEWSHGALEQALGRVYRVNSRWPVTAHVYLLKNTLEWEMFGRVCAKRNAIETTLFGAETKPLHIQWSH
jgi:superfamily II DNA or RNA helicase